MAAIERRIFVAADAGVGSCDWRERGSDIGEVGTLLLLERRSGATFLSLGSQESMVRGRQCVTTICDICDVEIASNSIGLA